MRDFKCDVICGLALFAFSSAVMLCLQGFWDFWIKLGCDSGVLWNIYFVFMIALFVSVIWFFIVCVRTLCGRYKDEE